MRNNTFASLTIRVVGINKRTSEVLIIEEFCWLNGYVLLDKRDKIL